MRNLGSDNHAVVAWLGYDTSSDIPREGMKGYAEPGTTALAPFVGGLRAVNIRQAEVTVMGHSYGSTVAGMGRHRRHGANRLIVVGSPGHAPGPAEE